MRHNEEGGSLAARLRRGLGNSRRWAGGEPTGEAGADVLVDKGGKALAGEGEMLHGLDGVCSGLCRVVAVALAVAEFDVNGGVVEGEGGDTGVGIAVGLHGGLDV